MKSLFIYVIGVLMTTASFAQVQTVVDSATANAVIEKCTQSNPKFYREYQYIKTHDTLIKRFIFFRSATQNMGPAFANPNGTIRIDLRYLETAVPDFDDNRLIVVLYHEIGHLHYFATTLPVNRNPADSEKAAFEYSLLKTKEIAENGDCLPLRTGLKFMKLRSESDNLADAHVRALKRMVNEPLYFEYLKYVEENCGK